MHTSRAIVNELSCSHNVRALIGEDEGEKIRVMSERQTGSKMDEAILECAVLYIPVDLTHVPPHEPRPL